MVSCVAIQDEVNRLLGGADHAAHGLDLRPQLKHQSLDANRSQPDLKIGGRDDHLLDQQFENPSLLGWKQLIPDRIAARHGDHHFGFVQCRVQLDLTCPD